MTDLSLEVYTTGTLQEMKKVCEKAMRVYVGVGVSGSCVVCRIVLRTSIGRVMVSFRCKVGAQWECTAHDGTDNGQP